MRQAEVHMPTVAHPIVNAVRNQHAVGPAGKIMIEGVKRLRAADSTGPKKFAEMLFRFGVNRKRGIAGFFVFRDQIVDPLKLRIAVWRVTTSEVFPNLP